MLLDVASYYWALREEPYGFRYEWIGLEPARNSPTQGQRAVVVVCHPRRGAQRWTTVFPVPVPAAIASDVTGLGFTIREWIVEGGGRAGGDGSIIREL